MGFFLFYFLNLFLYIQPLPHFLLHTSKLQFHNATKVIPPAPENRTTRVVRASIPAAGLKPRVTTPAPPSTWAAFPAMGLAAPPSQMWGQSSNQSVRQPEDCWSTPIGIWVYRPNMYAVNSPPIDTTTIFVPPTQSLTDFDSLTLEQMGISPGRWENHVPPLSSAPVQGRVETPALNRRGGRWVAAAVGEGEAAGGGMGVVFYSMEEFVVVARVWCAITEDPAVGTKTKSNFWARVTAAYNEF